MEICGFWAKNDVAPGLLRKMAETVDSAGGLAQNARAVSQTKKEIERL